MFSALDHDPKTGTLTATMKNGAQYHYDGVDTKTFADLMAAPSLGQHFARYIKPHYTARKG
jgi:hypothetical protein